MYIFRNSASAIGVQSDLSLAHRFARCKNYLFNTLLPVMILLPPNIMKASMEAVQSLCNMFPNDLKYNEALMAEIELAGLSIYISNAYNLCKAAKWFVGTSYTFRKRTSDCSNICCKK